MGVGDVDESFQCPCCIQCRECKDFQKVAEIKDTGLVIFRHLNNADDDVKQTEVLQPAVTPNEDVFILQKTRNVDIPSAKFVPTLETLKISCRRCRKMYERAQEFLKRVPNIGEKHVIGICDHCYQKQYPKSCDECEKVVNKFLDARHGERDTEDKFKTMLSKMEQVLRNVTSDAVKTVRATGRANSDLYINKPSQLDSRSPGKLKERDNVMLIPEMRRSDTNIPGSLQYKPRSNKHGESEERLLALDKSDRFKESIGAPQKYHTDQRPLSEVLEAGRREQREFVGREQSEFGARELRSVFEEPNRIVKQMRDSNLPTSLLNRNQQGTNENIEKTQHTLGKSSGFLDPMKTQKSRRADQRHDQDFEDFKMGTPAHSRLGTTEPRSILDEADRNKQMKMRDTNMSTPQQHKSKHAMDDNIKGHLQDLGKSVEFKDSIKSQKKHRPDKRYVPESVDTEQKHAGFEDRSVRSQLSEDGPIRPLVGNVLHKSPTQKQKKAVQKERSDTSVLTDKQGPKLNIKQTSKTIIKKTAPIGTRVKKHASKETLVSTISRAVQNTLGKELSYFFPVGDASGKRKKLKSTPTSTALILDTQKKVEEDKLRKEAEKNIELENIKKLAEEKAKLIAEKKRLAEEQKRIAEVDEKKRIAEEYTKKKQAEEPDKKSRTKKHEKNQNLADDKKYDKARDMGHMENDKGRIGHNEKDKSSSPEKNKIKSDIDRRDVEKNKNPKLERGDKETDNNKKENEKLAQERLKKEKEYKQEEKERLKKEKEQKLQQEKIDKQRERELKDAEKYKAKDEKELKANEKNKSPEDKKGRETTKYTDDTDSKSKHKSEKELKDKGKKEGIEEMEKQREKELKDAEKFKAIKEEKDLKAKEKIKLPEDKKARETSKYTDDTDSKPKHKSEKELNEKGRKEGIEEIDSKAKSKQMKDIKLNEDDLKQKDNQRTDKKELESKDKREKEPKSRDKDDKKRDGFNQTVVDSNIQKQEDIHMKKSAKNENQSKGERSKVVKNTQDEIENKKRQAINQIMDNKNKLNKTQTAGEKEQIVETKKQNKIDSENKQAKDLTDKNITENAKINAGDTKKGIAQPSDGEALKTGEKTQESKLKGLNLNQTKRVHDDLIIELVKQKQVNPSLRDRDKAALIDPLIIGKHKKHSIYPKIPTCIDCVDSNLELEIESIEQEKTKPKWTDIIIGEKVMKFIPPLKKKMEELGVMPSLFQTVFDADAAPMPIPREKILQVAPEEVNAIDVLLGRTKSGKQPPDPELTKGIMRYALSDRTFIDKGWTMLPTEKVVRKMNVYRMRPAQPEFDWFEHNRNKRIILYDSGERLAEFDDNGRGRWYYKNGHLALDYYDAEEINANQRFVLYSSGEPDERGRSRPVTILATFDYSGNGVVFDHAGKIRLKYNQTEGVVLDRGIGPVSHWKWHTLNDPPVLQQVMIDTQMALKDPQILKLGGPSDGKPRTDNEEMLAIEFDNFIKEKSKKLTQSFKPFQIKMKALKINEHFSLKVMDQATVYLIYRDGATNLKINIGMILDHKEIVDTDTAEVGEVSNNLERFPARTESLAGMQRSVAYAQRFERSRTERERRLRPPEPCSSADRLEAAAARPLHPAALRTAPTDPASASGCYCNVRKSSSCQIYYNTRLT